MKFVPGPGLGGHCIPIDPFYLTWKARESPTFKIMDLLKEYGAEVSYYDPHIPKIKPTREHDEWTGVESVDWIKKLLLNLMPYLYLPIILILSIKNWPIGVTVLSTVVMH